MPLQSATVGQAIALCGPLNFTHGKSLSAIMQVQCARPAGEEAEPNSQKPAGREDCTCMLADRDLPCVKLRGPQRAMACPTVADWRGMRVVIDATPLLVRSAGVKNYLYHWILHLRRAAGGAAVSTFPRMERVRPLTHQASVAGPLRTFSGLAALAVSNHTAAPLLDWLTRGADVFHASVLVRHPPKRVRLTATVHDLTGFLMPELHSP